MIEEQHDFCSKYLLSLLGGIKKSCVPKLYQLPQNLDKDFFISRQIHDFQPYLTCVLAMSAPL